MNHANAIRSFISTNFYLADPAALGDQDSLLESGIVDSTGVLEIVAFVESTFGVTVQDHEIVPENLDSITRIAAFVSRKTQRVPVA